MHRKIQSVNELAKFRAGDSAWWVILRPVAAMSPLTEEDMWIQNHHPKTYFDRGYGKALWASKKVALPKLQHMDFQTLVGVLTSKLVVEDFIVCDVIRSNDTGEFFYSNDTGEWMPESGLLDSKTAADREKTRILRMFQKWIDNNG